MKYRYSFHPEDYALGENEKFYSDMESRGWQLVKRGSHLSKFRAVEPSTARYRVEVVDGGVWEETGMPEEQVAVFADCGWEHITDQGLLHVFRAPAGSDAPEFYADPRQQAATLRALRRSYCLAWLPVVLVVALQLALLLMTGGSLQRAGAELQRAFVVLTAPCLLALTLAVWALWKLVLGAVSITWTYRRMKRGIPLDHAPGGRHVGRKAVSGMLLALTAVFALLSVWQLVGYEKQPLPERADGPYLLLEDLGFAGDRTYLVRWDNPCQAEHVQSLLAEYWAVREALGEDSAARVWMYQDVYRLSSLARAERFAQVLLRTATFIQDPEGWTPREVEGLDAVWTGPLEIVAVKGNLVFYITAASAADEPVLERALEALSELT